MTLGRRICLAVAVAVVAASLVRFDVPERAIYTDVRYYVHFATEVVGGALPHRDLFDNKPPLATFAGALLQLAGRPLGLEPLRAMRLGYLALAGLFCLLLFAVHRALRGGDCVAGLLGLLCSLGFTLLLYLPSIGPVPKLLMAVLATGAALLVLQGRWLAAGVAAGFAALDWQIGAVAGIGVLVAAACVPVRRARACTLVVAGGLAALLIFVGYFALRGGLEAAFEQIVGASLARGAASKSGTSLRIDRIVGIMRAGAPGEAWLAAVGVAGMALFPLWLFRLRGTAAGRMAIVLGVYGYGVVGFNLIDFQAFGDLLAVLHCLAFFAGVAVVEAHGWLERLVAARPASSPAVAARRTRVVPVAALVALAVAVRLWRGPTELRLFGPSFAAGYDLSEQKEVAAQLDALLAGRKALFAGCAEMLFLTGYPNPVSFVFWNSATHAYYRTPIEDAPADTLERVIREADPDVVVCPYPRVRRRLRESGAFERVDLASRSGRYRIVLMLARRGDRAHGRVMGSAGTRREPGARRGARAARSA